MPIPGTKHVRYLEENVAAAEVSLTDDAAAPARRAAPARPVAGERYLEGGMAAVER